MIPLKFLLIVSTGASLLACSAAPVQDEISRNYESMPRYEVVVKGVNVSCDYARSTVKEACISTAIMRVSNQYNRFGVISQVGNYPHEIAIPSGESNLEVNCQGVDGNGNEVNNTSNVQLLSEAGHVYQILPNMGRKGYCEVLVMDVTL